MKSIEELRTKVVPTKMSPMQYEKIKHYADEAGLTVSSYMLTRSLNNKGLTPTVLVRMQHLINIVSNIIEETEPQTMRFLKEEMVDLWEYLS